MIRLMLPFAVVLALCSLPAASQNVTVPTRPAGDNSNAAASTGFVQQALSPVTALQFGLAQSSIGNPGGTMSGYVAGDRITLQCNGISFATSPIIGVTAVSGGAVTSATLTVPGITSGVVPSGSATCSQASTTGSGTGYTVTATLGLYAAYIQPASLGTGGTVGVSNGNFFLNLGPLDTGLFNKYAGAEGTFIGDKAGTGFAGVASFATAVGHNACGGGGSQTSALADTCIGADAGRNIQDTNGFETLIGEGAGRNVGGGAGWNTFIGAQAAGSNGTNSAGTVTGIANVAVGFNTMAAMNGASGNVCLGAKACSAIVNGNANVILGATTGSDNCANGDESDVFAVCPGAGRVLTITGGGTPSTSVASFAGTLAANTPVTTQTTNYSIATTDCGTTIQAGTGATGQFTLTLPAVAGFPTTCRVTVKNSDTARGKLLSGFPSDLGNVLWPQQALAVQIINGAWATVQNPGRWRLPSATTFNVDTGGADTNDCLGTTSNACATIQGAMNRIYNSVDANAQGVTVSCATSQTYTGAITLNGPILNPSVNPILLNCQNSTINVTSANAVTVQLGAFLQLENVVLKTTTSGDCIFIALGGTVQIAAAGGVNFNGCATFDIEANPAGIFEAFGNYTISGNSGGHLHFVDSSTYAAAAITITVSGTPAWSNWFLGLSGSVADFTGTTISGAGTGQRYLIHQRSMVNTGSAANPETFLPGNAVGATDQWSVLWPAKTPTLSACGTSPSILVSSTDWAGFLAEGTTATGCTITFTAVKTSTPNCVVSNQGNVALTSFGYSISTSAITISNSSASGLTINYVCQSSAQ